MFLSLSGSTRTRPTEALGQIATVPRSTVHRSTRAQGSIGPRAYDTRRQPQSTFRFRHHSRTLRDARLLSFPGGLPYRRSSSQASPRAIPQVRLRRHPEPRGNMLIINRVVFLIEEAGMGSRVGPLPLLTCESQFDPGAMPRPGLALTQRPPFLGHSSRGVSTHATDNLHPPLSD